MLREHECVDLVDQWQCCCCCCCWVCVLEGNVDGYSCMKGVSNPLALRFLAGLAFRGVDSEQDLHGDCALVATRSELICWLVVVLVKPMVFVSMASIVHQTFYAAVPVFVRSSGQLLNSRCRWRFSM